MTSLTKKTLSQSLTLLLGRLGVNTSIKYRPWKASKCPHNNAHGKYQGASIF